MDLNNRDNTNNISDQAFRLFQHMGNYKEVNNYKKGKVHMVLHQEYSKVLLVKFDHLVD